MVFPQFRRHLDRVKLVVQGGVYVRSEISEAVQGGSYNSTCIRVDAILAQMMDHSDCRPPHQQSIDIVQGMKEGASYR